MTPTQYNAFLEDPVQFLNHPIQGHVKQIRLDSSMASTKKDDALREVKYDSGKVVYLSATNYVAPVYFRYNNTEFESTSALHVSRTLTSKEDYASYAYYLKWRPDMAYAMELPFKAKFFFTAELTGCGIIFLTGKNKTIIVHHNIQVTSSPSRTFWERLFDSNKTRMKKEGEYCADMRDEKLFLLAQDIIKSNSDITGGKLLSVKNYGSKARIFGTNSSGTRWKFFINYSNDGKNYITEALYE